MSLRSFHLVFISLSSLLSIFLILWGMASFWYKGGNLGIFLSVVGLLWLSLLYPYYRWFKAKSLKLLPAFVLVFSYLHANSAQACATCALDPNSLMTKGAFFGVAVLGAIILAVLVGIVYIAYTWSRRARLLSTHL